MQAAGNLNQPVEILAWTTTRDAKTQQVLRSASVVGSAWAEVVPLSDHRSEQARQLFEGATVEFRVRYNPDLVVTAKHGIRHRGVDYEIGVVLNLRMANETLRLVCREAR